MILRTTVVSMGVAIFVLLNSSNLHSGELDGSNIIAFRGAVASGVSTRVSVKEIESIGISEVELFDPFDKKNNVCTGVWLDQLVKHFGDQDVGQVSFKAIDGYQISFSRSEWSKTRIMVVSRINKKYIDLEDKGPLRVIFPDYDPDKDNSKEILPKWIWMIKTISFK